MRLSEIIYLCDHLIQQHGNVEAYLLTESGEPDDFSMYYLMPEVVMIPVAPQSPQNKVVLTFGLGEKFTSFAEHQNAPKERRLRLVK